MPPTRILPIHGTWTDNREGTEWIDYSSPWWRMMHDYGFAPDQAAPFEWSGKLVGFDFWNTWLAWLPGISHDPEERLKAWFEAQELVRHRLALMPGPRVLIVHSHGLQPALLAAASGETIDRMVSIGSPNRNDVANYIVRRYGGDARKNIGRWWHVMDVKRDVIGMGRWPRPRQSAGQIGDGAIAMSRIQRLADKNLPLPAIGHSGILSDPGCFHWWADAKIVEFLHGRN